MLTRTIHRLAYYEATSMAKLMKMLNTEIDENPDQELLHLEWCSKYEHKPQVIAYWTKKLKPAPERWGYPGMMPVGQGRVMY
jgi:hypothetical protein